MIVIRGNRIESVGDAATAKVPPDATVIDLSNATVLPGLIDSHTHIFLQGEDPAEGGYDVQLLKYPLRLPRRAGHGLRPPRAGAGLHHPPRRRDRRRRLRRRRHQAGDRGGLHPRPRLFVVTRAISTTGGYPLEGYAPEIDVPKGAQIVDGPVEARKAAREQLDHGADWIKVYMTHRSWVGRAGRPRLAAHAHASRSSSAIVDEAHGWGKKVACHAYSGIGLQRALDGGCDSIEHGLELDDAAVAQMVKQGTWYCPTLPSTTPTGRPPDTPAGKRDRERAAVHGAVLQEGHEGGSEDRLRHRRRRLPLDRAHRAGISADGRVRHVADGRDPSATSRAAEMLGMTGQIGVIAPGAYADVVAVTGDPLQNIEELGRVQFVMKDGKVFKNEMH